MKKGLETPELPGSAADTTGLASAAKATADRCTQEGSLQATGLGSLKDTYRELLMTLYRSGVVLSKFDETQRDGFAPVGQTSTIIRFTVEGTRAELEVFKRWLFL